MSLYVVTVNERVICTMHCASLFAFAEVNNLIFEIYCFLRFSGKNWIDDFRCFEYKRDATVVHVRIATSLIRSVLILCFDLFVVLFCVVWCVPNVVCLTVFGVWCALYNHKTICITNMTWFCLFIFFYCLTFLFFLSPPTSQCRPSCCEFGPGAENRQIIRRGAAGLQNGLEQVSIQLLVCCSDVFVL